MEGKDFGCDNSKCRLSMVARRAGIQAINEIQFRDIITEDRLSGIERGAGMDAMNETHLAISLELLPLDKTRYPKSQPACFSEKSITKTANAFICC